MSMNNKQRWMGGVVLLGGGVLLAALLLKGQEEIHQKQTQTVPTGQTQKTNQVAPVGEAVQLQPLTVDVATEKRLLEEQKRSRERAVAEQEAKAAEFLRMQQQAEADAARKAAEEYAAMNARRNATAVREGTDLPPEMTQDDKTKAQQKIDDQKKLEAQKKADTEKKLNEQKRQATEAENKAAEEKKRKAQEDAKKKADADKKAEAMKKVEADRKKAADEIKRKEQEAAKKKAEAEKARKLLEDGDRGHKQWMVQVALAANEDNADAVASKLRAKGYKVTQSKTSKGIRIMVGPSKDRDAADVTRKKINADESLGMKSAWINEWTPLDKR
ncbi:SPOR domain-containing protein [Acinetobacter sp. TY2]|uniref:SPOR domain-containing protein n=1 Tax=Acinetobacter sp. TY2 TaxID=3387403 RepID=UPI00391786FD